MTTQVEIPPNKAPELVKHLNEVINAVQDVNNGLAARLTGLPDFPDAALTFLKEWLALINDVHAASDVFVSKLITGNSAAHLQ